MFRNVGVSINKNLHKVMVDNLDFSTLGLYLDKEYIFEYPPLIEEIEEVFPPGRDGSLTKHKRYLNRNFTIMFNIKESEDFNNRISQIYNVLDSKKGKLITINEESVGFKLKRYYMESIQRGIGVNTVTIVFVCDPFLYNKNGVKVRG